MHQEAENDDEQPIGRIGHAQQLDCVPASAEGRLDAERDVPPDDTEHVEEDEDQPECHQHLVHRAGMAHAPDEAEIEHRSQRRDGDRRQEKACPVGAVIRAAEKPI